MTARVLAGVRRGLGRLQIGEWRVLAIALCVCTAAAGAVGILQQRLAATLERSSADALGADARIWSREDLPRSWPAQALGFGLRVAEVVEFPSVVTRGDHFQLVSVKAVGPGYPLRSQFLDSEMPFGPEHVAQLPPPRGGAMVDARLWAALDLGAGATFTLGSSTLRLSSVIVQEPDRGGAFADLQPRLLVNLADLAVTGLLAPGARVTHQLLLAGAPAALEQMHALVRSRPGAAWQTPRSARPEVARSVDRAVRFVRLSVLLTALLCASAVGLSAQRLTARLGDEVALLKTMGATRARVAARLLSDLGSTWVLAVLLGLPIAWAVQAGVVRSVEAILNAPPAPARPGPLAAGAALAALVLAAFALPPLWRLRDVPPVRILQRQAQPGGWRLGLVGALAGVLALLWLEAGNAQMLGWMALATAGCALALALLASALGLALGRLGGGASAWRQALRLMVRRRAASLAQVVALGVAMLSLVLSLVVRGQLLGEWRAQLPPHTPNEFIINVLPDQVEAVRRLLAREGEASVAFSPMTRARLVALRGVAVTAATFKDDIVRNWVDREFNLSWGDTFTDDNELLQGHWWGPAQHGQPILSVEQTAAERLGLHVGDTLALDFAGRTLVFTVFNTRKTRWDRFRPNFFFVAPPGVLESGPTQWITSLYVAPAQRRLLLDLVRAFPNVTPLDITAALDQVRRIIDEVGNAIAALFGFSIAGGALVLLAVIEASRGERRRETALLRVLGASRGRLVVGILAEYAALGLVAGAAAGVAGEIVAWALARFVFSLQFAPSLLVLLGAPLAGTLASATLGTLALLPVTATPPRRILEQEP